MTDNLEEKAVKETLKKIIDGNNAIPHEAKAELKMIHVLYCVFDLQQAGKPGIKFYIWQERKECIK